MKRNGIFITFEGTDGVGKSTQLKLAADWLRGKNLPVTVTREPGGGPISEKIRELILNPKNEMEDLTELFLYEAARVEHVAKVIRPSLKKGDIVLCDRFTDATVAYQGHARGLGQPVHRLNNIATGGLQPDLTILLDLPPKIGLDRAVKAKSYADRLEKEGPDFQSKVRDGYLLAAKENPRRIKIIQVARDPHETQANIRDQIERKLRGYSWPTASASLSV